MTQEFKVGDKVKVVKTPSKSWKGYADSFNNMLACEGVVNSIWPYECTIVDFGVYGVLDFPNDCLELVQEVSPDKHIEAIRELLKTRSEVGLKKYGVTLERKDLKPSEWAQHLLEELLDAAGYIHRLKEDLETIERFGK